MSEVNQSLVLAAKEGLIDLVRELLAKPGVNVDYNEYKDLNSALHWAAKNNNVEVAKLLIAANANVNLRNKNKKTPLHHCAEWNRPEIAQLLVACPSIDLNVVNKFLQTPLHEAAVKNHFEVVEILLTAGANHKLVNNNKNTPLHLASFYGHTQSVEALLKAGAGVRVVNELKQTPLHNAGNISIARMIIEAGAEIDAQDVDLETVLHYEARKGHADMLEMLLNAGADSYLVNKDGYAAFDLAEGFEARDTIKIAAFKKAEADRVRHTLDTELADAAVEETFQDNPPLESIYEPLPVIPEGLANNCELVQLCKAGENLDRIKELLTLPDVDVNFQLENKSRNTALHWAAKCGKLEVVQLLLANKANMHIRNKSKKTPLHYAAEYNGLQIAVLLIAAGADVNALNRWRQTPLHEAASRGYLTMVSLLLSENANTKLQNNNKNTPLHLAAGIGYVDIVKALLSAGAYVNIVNDSNETPLHHAKTVEILQLLVDAGADVDIQDKNNDTALHHETRRGNLEGVKVLLAAGCDVFLINHDGYSPYHLTDDPEIKQIIKDAGNSKLKVQRTIQPLPSSKGDEPKPLTLEELQAENAKLRQQLKTVQGESDIHQATATQALKDLKLATSQLQHISRTYDKVFGNLQLIPEDRTLLHARLDSFLNQGGMTDFSLEGLVTFNERASMDIALGEGDANVRKSVTSGGSSKCIVS